MNRIIIKYKNKQNHNEVRNGRNEVAVVEDVGEGKRYSEGVWDEAQNHHNEEGGDKEEINEILKSIGWPMHAVYPQVKQNHATHGQHEGRNLEEIANGERTEHPTEDSHKEKDLHGCKDTQQNQGIIDQELEHEIQLEEEVLQDMAREMEGMEEEGTMDRYCSGMGEANRRGQ